MAQLRYQSEVRSHTLQPLLPLALQELEQKANEEWAQELGLGSLELRLLPPDLKRGPHLFLEPDVLTPTVSELPQCESRSQAGQERAPPPAGERGATGRRRCCAMAAPPSAAGHGRAWQGTAGPLPALAIVLWPVACTI